MVSKSITEERNYFTLALEPVSYRKSALGRETKKVELLDREVIVLSLAAD